MIYINIEIVTRYIESCLRYMIDRNYILSLKIINITKQLYVSPILTYITRDNYVFDRESIDNDFTIDLIFTLLYHSLKLSTNRYTTSVESLYVS